MHAPLLYIPLAIEWVILITAFMPKLLSGMFYSTPKIGLTLWFTYLTSTILAGGLAIYLSAWALTEFFNQTWGADSIELELLNHFGLWVLVAITGIVISIVNLRTEPLVAEAEIAKNELVQASQGIGEFQGIPVRKLLFPVPLAFVAKVEGKQTIMISESAISELSEEELNATYWHELGHIRGHHNLINAVAKLIGLFTPMFSASKIFIQESRELTERAADTYAKRHASVKALESARAKFLE